MLAEIIADASIIADAAGGWGNLGGMAGGVSATGMAIWVISTVLPKLDKIEANQQHRHDEHMAAMSKFTEAMLNLVFLSEMATESQKARAKEEIDSLKHDRANR